MAVDNQVVLDMMHSAMDRYVENIVIVPSQWAAANGARQDSAVNPLKKLMLAVLEDALHCWAGAPNAVANMPASKRASLQSDASDWLFGPDADGVFSFATICGVFGWDANAFRRALRIVADKREKGVLGLPSVRRNGAPGANHGVKEGTRYDRPRTGVSVVVEDESSAFGSGQRDFETPLAAAGAHVLEALDWRGEVDVRPEDNPVWD